jgi:predicted nucleic acid-binding protein
VQGRRGVTIVVDANIALLWTIEAPLSGKANLLLRSGHALIAPDLIIPEMANALYFQIKDRADRVQRALDGLEFLPRWFSELVPSEKLRHRAMACAMEIQHPAYDCFYLALAESRNVFFVTTDAHFIGKASGSGHGGRIVHLEKWKP